MTGWAAFAASLPFTFACFIIGGLALSGMPPFSGWLSKDDILAYLDHRGGGFLVLGIAGYVGAFLTGIYTFRMIFRAFFGDPVPEAVELEHGHLAHAEVPTNPLTGEVEDTDVGFPGPGHYIAEREWPMKIAMSVLAFGAIVDGLLQIPGVDRGVERFLDPTFADSHLYGLTGSTRSDWVGLIIGAAIAIAGISIAFVIWVRSPGTARTLQQRFAAIHTLLAHKWYFDELLDFVVVRPALWLGRFADGVLERIVISGTITGGTVGVVRAGSAAVRRLQTGFLRYYAAALIVGISAMTLYFLITST